MENKESNAIVDSKDDNDYHGESGSYFRPNSPGFGDDGNINPAANENNGQAPDKKKVITRALIIGSVFIAITFFALMAFWLAKKYQKENDAAAPTAEIENESARLPEKEPYFKDKVINNNGMTVEQLLNEYVSRGPFDDTWGCDKIEDCMRIVEEKMEKGIYDEANDIFLSETRKLHEKFSIFKVDVDGYLGEGAAPAEFYENADAIAKEVLIWESYRFEKAVNYSNFYQFVKLFEANFQQIEKIVSNFEDYKPLTKEQEDLVRSKYAQLKDSQGNVKVDDIWGEFDFMDGVAVSLDGDGNLIFPPPKLRFPIIVINQNRIAGHLGEWFTATSFDLVKINGRWKVDLIEPSRPGKEKNPRILIYGYKEDALNERWKTIEEVANSLSGKMSIFNEFKEWWAKSSNKDKDILFADVLDGYNLEEDDYFEMYGELFVRNIPKEEGQALRYEKNGFTEKPLVIRKTGNGIGWAASEK